MVEHSLQRAAELGYLGLQFTAVAATNRPAIKLYEELGFGTVGVIPRGFRHPSAGLVDLLIMYREVTPIR
jgi:ribosomal protein S18 acetylase RimI-like enzyme